MFQHNVAFDYYKRDGYGRLVATVLLAGEDVNLKQIQAGLAWHFKSTKASSLPKSASATRTQKKPRAAHIGLWGEVRPVAPWEFREQRRARSP